MTTTSPNIANDNFNAPSEISPVSATEAEAETNTDVGASSNSITNSGGGALSESFDLTTESGVRAYLAKTAFASADIVPLTGGTANYVYRLALERAYEGRGTLVLKHAKPYVKSWKDLAFGLERQIYEVAALRHVGAWLPKDSIVRVPAVHLFDEEEHVIIMDDAGADTLSLKAFIQQGQATVELASQIGAAVGTFLGRMHRWGKGNKELCDAVKGNTQAKTMTAWAFYGRLRSTLDGTNAPENLQDPPLKASDEDLEVIDQLAAEATKALLEIDDQFVMGDFWPGNLMVQVEDGKLKEIIVLDWELAKAGLVADDVGQFAGEIHMLRRCHPEVCRETATALLDAFLSEYKKGFAPSVDVVKHILVRWGIHMAVLGARVDWGGKELSRAVVTEGARLVVDGYRGDREWLRDSYVGHLL